MHPMVHVSVIPNLGVPHQKLVQIIQTPPALHGIHIHCAFHAYILLQMIPFHTGNTQNSSQLHLVLPFC